MIQDWNIHLLPWFFALQIFICPLMIIYFTIVSDRSSCPEVFCKKGVLENFLKFTGKHLCQSLFFNKTTGLRPATFLIERPWRRSFPANFAKLWRTPFLIEQFRWLLLVTLCNRPQFFSPDYISIFNELRKTCLLFQFSILTISKLKAINNNKSFYRNS